MAYQAVSTTRELGPGQLITASVDGDRVAVANIGQTYHALEVPGKAKPVLDGDALVLGDARFDMRTGARLDAPEKPGLTRRSIQVEANQVKVGPPESAAPPLSR